MTIPPIPKNVAIVGGIILFAIVAGAPSFYFYNQYKSAQKRLANPDLFAKEEDARLIEAVSKLIELPGGGEPTVASVTDSERLKTQPFFASVQNGDKVLIFTNAKKAILYRPSQNKIINVDSVTLNASGSATPQTTTSSVVIRNGTAIVGLTRSYEEKIKEKIPSLIVAARENAKRRDHKTSILVDVSGKKSQEAATIAKTLGIAIDLIPPDEATPTSDFLIILGEDKKE